MRNPTDTYLLFCTEFHPEYLWISRRPLAAVQSLSDFLSIISGLKLKKKECAMSKLRMERSPVQETTDELPKSLLMFVEELGYVHYRGPEKIVEKHLGTLPRVV